MKLTVAPTRGRKVRGFGAPPATPTSPPSHLGEDWGWVDEPYGEPIFCPAPGKVRAIGHSGDNYGYGRWTEVDHGNGWSTLYAHQHFRNVAVGDRVEAGTILGGIGASGNTRGPHLHFELRRNGVPIDPAPFYQIGAPAGDRDPVEELIERTLIMKTAIVEAPNGTVVQISTGFRRDFKSPQEYNLIRDNINALIALKATDMFPLPPLKDVPKVTWEVHNLLSDVLNAPLR